MVDEVPCLADEREVGPRMLEDRVGRPSGNAQGAVSGKPRQKGNCRPPPQGLRQERPSLRTSDQSSHRGGAPGSVVPGCDLLDLPAPAPRENEPRLVEGEQARAMAHTYDGRCGQDLDERSYSAPSAGSSMAEVASSMNTHAGRWRKMRPNARRCCSPRESTCAHMRLSFTKGRAPAAPPLENGSAAERRWWPGPPKG